MRRPPHRSRNACPSSASSLLPVLQRSSATTPPATPHPHKKNGVQPGPGRAGHACAEDGGVERACGAGTTVCAAKGRQMVGTSSRLSVAPTFILLEPGTPTPTTPLCAFVHPQAVRSQACQRRRLAGEPQQAWVPGWWAGLGPVLVVMDVAAYGNLGACPGNYTQLLTTSTLVPRGP